MTRERPALATYRFQFTPDFPFEEARALLPYLDRLGITHIYSSPILKSRRGSTHGYDIIDPARVNPELGGEAGFHQLIRELHARRMGMILDIVPNHMAAVSQNPYWNDVLTYGPASPYARWFDIDWRLPDPQLWGRVLIPVLGEPLPKAISQDQLAVVFEQGLFRVRYYEHAFPLDPATLPQILNFSLNQRPEQLPFDHPALIELRRILKAFRLLPRRTVRMRRRIAMPLDAAQKALDDLRNLSEENPDIREWLQQTAQNFGQGPEGRRRLEKLLGAQSYRLAYWRRAARVINYRRFFDINDLVAVRQEDPEVFDETHTLITRWVREDLLDGIRVDHVDGLRDPLGYLQRLSDMVSPEKSESSPLVFVEKILAPEEHLSPCWPVAGTTGYEFANQVEAILISPEGDAEIVQEYRRILRRRIRFKNVVLWGKRRVLKAELSAFVGKLARTLLRLSRYDDETSGLRQRELVEAIVETVVCLPVYRTYVDSHQTDLNPQDRHYLEMALAGARRRQRVAPEALDFLEQVLLLKQRSAHPENELQERLNFIQRFQQLSGPAAAKGVEDTALYVYVPLVSRNEVGGEPDLPLDDALPQLHRANRERARHWPQTILSVTTHDTKRSADVRSRLDVLSELPKLWGAHFQRWRRWNRKHRTRLGSRVAPDVNTEYLLYQTLIGIWPAPDPAAVEETFPDSGQIQDLCQRTEQYMLKAVRETKVRTSWVDPDPEFEEAVANFVQGMLLPEEPLASRFLKDLNHFVARLARPGFWNALSRTLTQLTAPGIPDIYQGDETWNLCLVDPDNRRPVDFEARKHMLEEVVAGFESSEHRPAFIQQLLHKPEDGRIKLHLIHRILQARHRSPDLFSSGDYEPLQAEGPRKHHLFNFARIAEKRIALTVAPRLTISLVEDPAAAPIGPEVWSDTLLPLPQRLRHLTWKSVLTGEILVPSSTAETEALTVSQVLKSFPVALLVADRTAGH